MNHTIQAVSVNSWQLHSVVQVVTLGIRLKPTIRYVVVFHGFGMFRVFPLVYSWASQGAARSTAAKEHFHQPRKQTDSGAHLQAQATRSDTATEVPKRARRAGHWTGAKMLNMKLKLLN